MRLLPQDSDISCGYGPLKLRYDHPFTRACELHDWEYSQSHADTPDKPIARVDWDLFYRWVIISKSASTDSERCRLALDICIYWPLARLGGVVLWDGDPIETTVPKP